MRIIDKNTQNLIYFPKNLNNFKEIHLITFTSEITNKSYSFDVRDEDNLFDYYVFTLDLSDLPDGEYKYNIDEDACGLIILGDLTKINTIYDKNNNKYIIYGE